MRKINAKWMIDNLLKIAYGEHIMHGGAEYWMSCDKTEDMHSDISNGTIYYISEDRRISGSINGHEYAKVVNGAPYRV